jgi:hypothetical protein
MKTRAYILSLLVTILLSGRAVANPNIAFEWLNVNTDITIRGFTIESNGTVEYECHYCTDPYYIKTGKHYINDGAAGRTVVSEAFGGLLVYKYAKTIGGPTAYDHCYQATLEATSAWKASQGMYSNILCAPGAPTPPSGGGELDACDHCEGGSIVYEPLILDLNGDGIWTTSSTTNPVWFDLNADGQVDRTGWTSPDHEEGFLFADWNGDHVVNDGSELFGDASITPAGTRANHGFEALGTYDQPRYGGNADGVISPTDDVWRHLAIWIDRNHNARLDTGERYKLRELGIVSLRLSYTKLGRPEDFGRDAAGNFHLFQGSYARRVRGRMTEGALHEIYFATPR